MNDSSRFQANETKLPYQIERIPSGPFFKVNFIDTAPNDPSKKTIIITHGLLSSIETWEPIIKQLQKTYRILGMDLRGHGRTEAIDRPYGIDDLVGDVASFIYSRGITRKQPVHLIGHSLGSAITLELISQELVTPKTVTLFAGTTRFRGHVIFDLIKHAPMLLDQIQIAREGTHEHHSILEKDLIERIHNQEVSDEIDTYQEQLVIEGSEETEKNQKFQQFLSYMKSRVKNQSIPFNVRIKPNSSMDVLFRIMKDFLWNWHVNKEYLQSCQVPFHLITGKRDAVLPVNRARELQEILPNAQLTVLPNATHLLPIENIQQTVRLITSFIENHTN